LINNLSWNRDNRYLAFTTGPDATVRIWPPFEHNLMERVIHFSRLALFTIYGGKISPDGKFIAITTETNIKIFKMPGA
jgi:hypothetical protein